MDRTARVRAELDRVKTEARVIDAAGPPCRDCRFITLTGCCSNPAYYRQEFKASSGDYKVRCETSVDDARSEDGLCGPEALLWEPQDGIRSFFNGIGRQMEAHPFLTGAAALGLLLLS
jgi:hypothetical protein